MKKSSYWFPAKRYGWGWGLPGAWQGRIVLVAYFVLLAAGAYVLLPTQGRVTFVVYALGLSAALVGVCLVKGEPPGWRAGK